MPEEDFLTNVARMIAASAYSSFLLQVAREMFGKSYFELGVGEKTVADQAAFVMMAAHYQSVTPENLRQHTAPGQLGFQPPAAKTSE